MLLVNKNHYRIVVIEVLETVYEVWADTEDSAKQIARIDNDVEHDHRHEYESAVHPPQVINVSQVSIVHQC